MHAYMTGQIHLFYSLKFHLVDILLKIPTLRQTDVENIEIIHRVCADERLRIYSNATGTWGTHYKIETAIFK